MKVQVTQAHIMVGRKSNCFECPIALAMRKVVHPNMVATVTCSILFIEYQGKETYEFSTKLPLDAQQFVSDFDNGFPVEPFEFEIEIPEKYLAA